MGFGDLVRNREIGSNAIIKGNLDKKCINHVNFTKKYMMFVKLSGEKL